MYRPGFCDVDAFGFGLVFAETWQGNLDAPDYMPQGSMRVHNTIRHAPHKSQANRDALAGYANIGVCHDDNKPAWPFY